MAAKFLFQDYETGLWVVDDATGIATNLSNLDNNADNGGIAAAGGQVLFGTAPK